jgi:hypothetical protein
MSPISWPTISYFHEGTRWAREVKKELVEVDHREWRILCRAKSDGSYWLLDAEDKFQTRFLTRLEQTNEWWQRDTSSLEKQLLYESRGGVSGERCMWAGCGGEALNRSAYCLEHTYAAGTRE